MAEDIPIPMPVNNGWYRLTDSNNKTLYLKNPRLGWFVVNDTGEMSKIKWDELKDFGSLELIAAIF